MNSFFLYLCRLILIVFNLILFIVGTVLITIGIGLSEARNILIGSIVSRLMRETGFHVTVEDDFVEMGLDLLTLLPDGVVLFIQIGGGVLLAIAISGILGTFCGRPLHLYVHAVVMFAAFVFLMFFMSQLITEAEFTRHYAIKFFMNGLNKSYIMKPKGVGSGFTFFMNNIQSKLNCCGIVNYTDFNITKDFKSSGFVVPAACCVNFNKTDCTKDPTPDNSHMNSSCIVAGWKKIGSFYINILLIAMVISVSLFTIMFCDIILGRHLKDDQKGHDVEKGKKKAHKKGGKKDENKKEKKENEQDEAKKK